MAIKKTITVAHTAIPAKTGQLDWHRLIFSGVAGLVALLLLAFGSLHGLVAVWARSWVASEPGIHHPEIHWITGVALIGVLSLAGFLAATRRPGWQVLGVLVGLALLHLGAATVTLPDQPGSWGLSGGVIAIMGGLFFIGVTILEMRQPTANLSN